jgi:hypothetical protein
MPTTTRIASLVAALATLTVAAARAESPAAQRALRNAEMAVNNVQLVPAYRAGAIPAREVQLAKNLLRDIDYAVGRASAELRSLSGSDAASPRVAALKSRVDELAAFRVDLKNNLEANASAAEALTEQYRAFREETQKFGEAVRMLRPLAENPSATIPIGADELTRAGVASLAELDALCKAKYAGIKRDQNTAFQLAIDPPAWCDVAARRVELVGRAVKGVVQRDLAVWLGSIAESTRALASNNGFVSLTGEVVEKLVYQRADGKAALAARYKPLFAIAGEPVPGDLLKPIDEAVDALFAEIDRLAPTWTWPAGAPHDTGLEAAAKKYIAAHVHGASVLRTAMVAPGWTIRKNTLGVPLSRFRTGIALYQLPGAKWCHYREFTRVEEFDGTGYAKNDGFDLQAIRYQKCP